MRTRRFLFSKARSITDFPVERFIGEAVPIDLLHKQDNEPMTPDDLNAYADLLRPGDIALLCMGWGELRDGSNRWLPRPP